MVIQFFYFFSSHFVPLTFANIVLDPPHHLLPPPPLHYHLHSHSELIVNLLLTWLSSFKLYHRLIANCAGVTPVYISCFSRANGNTLGLDGNSISLFLFLSFCAINVRQYCLRPSSSSSSSSSSLHSHSELIVNLLLHSCKDFLS